MERAGRSLQSDEAHRNAVESLQIVRGDGVADRTIDGLSLCL
jgi:hypothetical protein